MLVKVSIFAEGRNISILEVLFKGTLRISIIICSYNPCTEQTFGKLHRFTSRLAQAVVLKL